MNEHLALTAMADRSYITDKVILVADRGYESYNNIAHLEQKGWNYVICVRDKIGFRQAEAGNHTSFRVVRLRIADNCYETLLTNLNPCEFPASVLKDVFRLRWGIETSFRELKYAVGLLNFHSKKVEYITQEVFAQLIMYNFSMMITSSVIIQQKDTKYAYQVNFTQAIHICVFYFRCRNGTPPDVKALIRRYILPIRPGRSDRRNIRYRSAVSFLYRVA